MFLLGKMLFPHEYQFTDAEPIAGKSIVLNKAGFPYLYMGDDLRKEKPDQIIVKRIGNVELAYLPLECKRTIQLLNYEYV